MHKKNIFFIGLALTFLILVTTGCADNQKEEKTKDAEQTIIENNSDNKSVNSEEDAEDDTLDLANIESIYKFSNERTWITNMEESSQVNDYICIDQEGNALFYISNPNVSYVSPFSNNCSFIETDNAIYQIDLNGNIIKKYALSDNVKLKAYWEGQIWLEEYNSNFDSAGYTYTLYGENGEEITKLTINGTEPIGDMNCCGKGVWRYDTLNSDGNSVQMYYSTESNQWIETSTGNNESVYFYEDTAILGINYEDPDETGYRAKMVLMDTKGNLSEIGITGDLGWNWDGENYINEGYCILEDYEDHLISYNLSSGEFNVMDNEYAEKIRMDALPDKLMFMDGCVALPLKGSDENNYVGLFDTSWNIISEPIQCRKFDYSEGKLIVSQEVSEENQDGIHIEIMVYDNEGDLIFNAFEKGYKALISYKDGVAFVLNQDADRFTISGAETYSNLLTANDISDTTLLGGDWKGIDEKGAYLFNTINIAHTSKLELE